MIYRFCGILVGILRILGILIEILGIFGIIGICGILVGILRIFGVRPDSAESLESTESDKIIRNLTQI
jgi:hypothetical protein